MCPICAAMCQQVALPHEISQELFVRPPHLFGTHVGSDVQLLWEANVASNFAPHHTVSDNRPANKTINTPLKCGPL